MAARIFFKMRNGGHRQYAQKWVDTLSLRLHTRTSPAHFATNIGEVDDPLVNALLF